MRAGAERPAQGAAGGGGAVCRVEARGRRNQRGVPSRLPQAHRRDHAPVGHPGVHSLLVPDVLYLFIAVLSGCQRDCTSFPCLARAHCSGRHVWRPDRSHLFPCLAVARCSGQDVGRAGHRCLAAFSGSLRAPSIMSVTVLHCVLQHHLLSGLPPFLSGCA